MTLSALLLSTLAFDAAPAPSFDTTKLQGSGGIVILVPPKKKTLQGSAGIVILVPKKKEN